MEEEKFYQELIQFLTERNPGVKNNEINEDSNLWDFGLIDSFSMVELIVFLEKYIGKEIEVKASSLKSFHTMKRIFETFVNEKGKMTHAQ